MGKRRFAHHDLMHYLYTLDPSPQACRDRQIYRCIAEGLRRRRYFDSTHSDPCDIATKPLAPDDQRVSCDDGLSLARLRFHAFDHGLAKGSDVDVGLAHWQCPMRRLL